MKHVARIPFASSIPPISLMRSRTFSFLSDVTGSAKVDDGEAEPDDEQALAGEESHEDE